MTTPKRHLLTPEQLAEHFQLSLSWIRKRTMAPEARARNGIAEDLPHLRIGGAVRFDLREVEAWLRSQPRRRKKREGNG